MSHAEHRRITAYRLAPRTEPLRPLSRRRAWMDATRGHHAYHCLPMVMANQCGWAISSPVDCIAIWNGRRRPRDLKVFDVGALLGGGGHSPLRRLLVALLGEQGARLDALGPRTEATLAALLGHRRVWKSRELRRCELDSQFVESHFGSGVLTFRPRYVFRTSEGDNLWVKGPPNGVKDGIVPLEGIVESDWLPYTFTMNWKFTRPYRPVRFREGEAICAIHPFPRHYVESFRAVTLPLEAEPELAAHYETWHGARLAHHRALRDPDPVSRPAPQRHYLRGVNHAGTSYDAHQTKLSLDEFVDR